MEVFKVYAFYLLLEATLCPNQAVALSEQAQLREIIKDVIHSIGGNLQQAYNKPKVANYSIGIFVATKGTVEDMRTLGPAGNISHFNSDGNLYITMGFRFASLNARWAAAKCMDLPCQLVMNIKRNAFSLKLKIDPQQRKIEYALKVIEVGTIEIQAHDIQGSRFLSNELITASLEVMSTIANTELLLTKIATIIRESTSRLRLFTSEDVIRISSKVTRLNKIKIMNTY